jgi:hypothetical protein
LLLKAPYQVQRLEGLARLLTYGTGSTLSWNIVIIVDWHWGKGSKS